MALRPARTGVTAASPTSRAPCTRTPLLRESSVHSRLTIPSILREPPPADPSQPFLAAHPARQPHRDDDRRDDHADDEPEHVLTIRGMWSHRCPEQHSRQCGDPLMSEHVIRTIRRRRFRRALGGMAGTRRGTRPCDQTKTARLRCHRCALVGSAGERETLLVRTLSRFSSEQVCSILNSLAPHTRIW